MDKLDYQNKWDVRFADNDTFAIDAADLREFKDDTADTFGVGESAQAISLPAAQQLLSDQLVQAFGGYAVTGPWNTLDPDNPAADTTVYVLGLQASAFASTGWVLDATGEPQAVTVDVAVQTWEPTPPLTATQLVQVGALSKPFYALNATGLRGYDSLFDAASAGESAMQFQRVQFTPATPVAATDLNILSAGGNYQNTAATALSTDGGYLNLYTTNVSYLQGGSGPIEVHNGIVSTLHMVAGAVVSLFNAPIAFLTGSGGTIYLYPGTHDLPAVPAGITVVDRRGGGGGAAYTAGAGIDISPANVISATGGIDYANPVAHTTSATLTATSDLNKLHVLSGGSFTLTLPANPPAGARLRIQVASSAAGFYAISGNGTTINGQPSRLQWATESCELLYNGAEWVKLSGLSRAMSLRIRLSEPSFTYTTNQGVRVPCRTVVGTDPAQLHNAADGIVQLRRAGKYGVVAFNAIQNVPAGTHCETVARLSGQNNDQTVLNTIVPTNLNLAFGSATGTMICAATDYIELVAYCNQGGQALLSNPNTISNLLVEEHLDW